MTEKTTSLITKILVIIGFSATILLIAWLLLRTISNTPDIFSRMASIVRDKESAFSSPKELSVTTPSDVVTLGKEVEVRWTDMERDGEYVFGYTCVDDVLVSVRSAEGPFMPLSCDDTLTLPSTVHGLFVRVDSREKSFADVTLQATFVSNDDEIFEGALELTALRPVSPTTQNVATTTPDTPTSPTVSTPAPQQPTYTAPTIVYPTSNPYGYTDLKITIHGIGTFRNGVFGYTSTYTRSREYVMLVEIENLGTKTSAPWSFRTYIEDDVHYTSSAQAPLKPKEHIVFTLPFTAPRNVRDIDIEATVYTQYDSNTRNNTDSISRNVD
jgi:hypothetical protein